MKKTDFDKMMKKYQPVMRKTGKQLAKAVKVAEEDIAKMYRAVQIHVEIQMKNLQKEKFYHELGKYVAGKLADESFAFPGLEKYKKRLEKINAEGENIKKKLKSIGKKKRTPKKK